MAQGLQVGESVLVAASHLGMNDSPNAIIKGEVTAVIGRTAQVKAAGVEKGVATSKLHRDFGLLLLTVGDLDTENDLLGPLGSSLRHYLRLLFPTDGFVESYTIRTRQELRVLWPARHNVMTHVVLIGHGREDAIQFIEPDGWVTGIQLAQEFAVDGVTPKEFVSLACKTGRQQFSSGLSSGAACARLIAPFQSTHGAVAAQYFAAYIANVLLAGETTAVAHRHALSGMPPGSSFRLWQNGAMR